MMLIIAEKNPCKNAEFIIENTSKNFVFKSLLELAQLVCSCGISKIYKPVKQGKKLQEWIDNNRLWVFRYFTSLYFWSLANIKMEIKTVHDLYKIRNDLWESIEKKKRIRYPKKAILRYSTEYRNALYATNSELPLDICIREYRRYITEFKFPRKVVNG